MKKLPKQPNEEKPLKLTIDFATILIKMKDGNVYPANVKDETMNMILNLIVQVEGMVSIIDKPIYGLEITKNN